MSDILTTAQAATLLGVSIRTAQLWVERGQLPSWKTPGGHRRIPRPAVLELIAGRPAPLISARAIVLAGEDQRSSWEGLIQCGFVVDIIEDPLLAAARIGETLPALIVIDDDGAGERLPLIDRLQDVASLAPALVLCRTDQPIVVPKRFHHIRLPKSVSISECLEAIVADFARNSSDVPPAEVAYPLPPNEAERLKAVENSGLLFSPREPSFDRLVDLAARLFDTPLAMVSLLTESQQWFKASHGYAGDVTPREWSLCNFTVTANGLTVIEDITLDPRLAGHATIEAPFGFRFYAGAPVRDHRGYALGSLCVIDRRPRSFGPEDRDALTTLADAASRIIKERGQMRELREAQHSSASVRDPSIRAGQRA